MAPQEHAALPVLGKADFDGLVYKPIQCRGGVLKGSVTMGGNEVDVFDYDHCGRKQPRRLDRVGKPRPEGEVAFIACGLLTSDPVRRESILGRPVLVETATEILAKKLWHRAASFAARDLFDLAAVEASEPTALDGLGGLLRANRAVLFERFRAHDEALREDFAALHAWEFHPRFEECVAVLRTALSRPLPPPVVEQERYPYELGHGGVSGSGATWALRLRDLGRSSPRGSR